MIVCGKAFANLNPPYLYANINYRIKSEIGEKISESFNKAVHLNYG